MTAKHVTQDQANRHIRQIHYLLQWFMVIAVLNIAASCTPRSSCPSKAMAASRSSPSRRRAEKAGEVSHHLVHLRWKS
jgi:hypothetical protein